MTHFAGMSSRFSNSNCIKNIKQIKNYLEKNVL